MILSRSFTHLTLVFLSVIWWCCLSASVVSAVWLPGLRRLETPSSSSSTGGGGLNTRLKASSTACVRRSNGAFLRKVGGVEVYCFDPSGQEPRKQGVVPRNTGDKKRANSIMDSVLQDIETSSTKSKIVYGKKARGQFDGSAFPVSPAHAEDDSEGNLTMPNEVATAKILFYDSNYARQFPPFAMKVVVQGSPVTRSKTKTGSSLDWMDDIEGVTSWEVERGMIKTLGVNTTFLRDLSNVPRLESLFLQTIQSYYVFLDELLIDPFKEDYIAQHRISLGLPPALFRNFGFRSFLKAHHRQLRPSARRLSVKFLDIYPSEKTSDDDSPINYLFTVAHMSCRALTELMATEINGMLIAAQTAPSADSINSYLSQKSINIMLSMVRKIKRDIRLIRTSQMAFFVDLTNKKGLIWERSVAPPFSQVVSGMALPGVDAQNSPKAYASIQRMLLASEELRKEKRVYSLLMALRVIHRKLLEFTLPGPIARAFAGEGLMNPTEAAVYALRNTATTVQPSPFVQAHMLQLLIDVSMGVSKESLDADEYLAQEMNSDLEKYLPILLHNQTFVAATGKQRCLAGLLRLMLTILEKSSGSWSERMSMPLSRMIRAFMTQLWVDLRDLNALIGLAPLHPEADVFQVRFCHETSAHLLRLFGI